MDEAEFFLPSEIARLVYGHLKTMGCDEVTAKFLNESPHLSECRELHKRTRSFNTEANGLSLKEILEQFLNMNKLILSAANMMSDSEKFKNPVEALNFMLNPSSVISNEQSSVVVNSTSQAAHENQSQLSSSSDEEFFSDISLNLKTPDKSRSAKKYTKKKLESVHEEDHLSDKSEPENTPVVNKILLKKPMILLPRQSTRLQMKRASNKERLSNSDGLKDFRKSPSDCETPRKIGKPPYSETKLQKPKISITLTSSDSENENVANTSKTNSSISDDLNSTKDSCKNNPVNGLFPPETKKITPKKKTLKVLRPRRPPSSPLKRPSVANGKVQCKRDRSSEQNTSKEYVEENKNTESSQPSNLDSQVMHENDNSDKPPRTSEELIFTTELSQNSEKSTKVRRKSVHAIQKDEEKTTSKQNKANKSMIMINDETIREKLMENPKLHEHIAGNINKIVYSPQKKINLASKEEVDNAVKEIVNTTTSDPLFDELLKDLFGNLSNDEDNVGDEQNSNLPSQPEHTEKDNVCTVSNDNEQNQTQMPEIAAGESSIVIEEDIASHTSEPNAIIIEISQEQLSNQNYSLEQSKNYEKPLSSTEDIRTYLSFSADVSSSPDRDHSNVKANDNFVTFTAENGEFVQSCEIASENERIYVNPNSVLYPVTEGVPLVVGKRTKFEMCGAPSQLAQITRKQKYVPIAPKPNNYEIIGEAEPTPRNIGITKKKRTRGGRRP